MRSRISSARCSAISGASKSSAISGPSSSDRLKADAQKVAPRARQHRQSDRALEEANRGVASTSRSAHGRALQAGQRRLRAPALQCVRSEGGRPCVSHGCRRRRDRSSSRRAASAESRPAARGAWLARSAAGRDGQAAAGGGGRAHRRRARGALARAAHRSTSTRAAISPQSSPASCRARSCRLQQTLAAINSGTPRPAADGSALPIRPFRGDLDWPVAGRMLTPFGRAGTGVSRAAGADAASSSRSQEGSSGPRGA